MSIADLSSRAAVLQAVGEFDQRGRDEFLLTHGYGPARRYFLEHGGRLYDSKAIVGVAHAYQFPAQGRLRGEDFSGGAATVQRKLEELGFVVRVLSL